MFEQNTRELKHRLAETGIDVALITDDDAV